MPDVSGGAVGGIIGGLGSLFGGGGDDSALQAAQLQYQATMAAIAEQKRALTEARGYMAPYYAAGTNALAQYGGELNLPGFAPKDPTAALRATPGYDFTMQQGVNARDRSAAARGMLGSGAQQKGLTAYGQGLGDQTYNNYLNRIGGMMTSGQNAAALQGGYGMTAAPQIGNYLQQGAAAQGQGLIGAYNARQSSYGNLMNNVMGGLGSLGYGLQNWLNQPQYGGYDTSLFSPSEADYYQMTNQYV